MRERRKRKHKTSLSEVLTLEEAMDLLLDYVKMMKEIISVVTGVSLLVPG
jgi:2-phospho-L-lactate guanylyltransferase (CobY/MobA/RfbA family)